jgi:hypothetical protein
MGFIHELLRQSQLTTQMATHLNTQDSIKIPNSLIQFLDRSQERLLQIFLDINLAAILPIDNKGRSISRSTPEQCTISLV